MVKLAKRLMAMLAVAAGALLTAGCGEIIEEGEVLSKRFDPAHDEENMMMIEDAPMWTTDHYPDRWYITIGKKCEDGKYRKRECLVTKETYDTAQNGQWMNFK